MATDIESEVAAERERQDIPREVVEAFERLEELDRQRERIRKFLAGWDQWDGSMPTDQDEHGIEPSTGRRGRGMMADRVQLDRRWTEVIEQVDRLTYENAALRNERDELIGQVQNLTIAVNRLKDELTEWKKVARGC